MLDPGSAPPPEVALADAMAEFLVHRQRQAEAGAGDADRPSTLRGRRKKLRVILRYLGADSMVSDLTRERVEAFRDERIGDVSAHSAYKDLCELRGFCGWCAGKGYLRENPADGVGVSFKTEKKDRAITPEEFRKLYDALPEKRRLYALMAVETGVRPGEEIESIVWGGVDAERNLVHVPGTKTAGADRHLRVRPEFSAHLAAARNGGGDGDRVVGERWGNAPRDFKRACELAGIRHVRPYDLRHTFASWALQGGAPDAHVAKALGHATTAMVHKVYGHLRPEHLATVAAALPDTPCMDGSGAVSESDEAETGGGEGDPAENLAPHLPQAQSETGANASIISETKNPAESCNPAGSLENREATTRFELVNGGFAAIPSAT